MVTVHDVLNLQPAVTVGLRGLGNVSRPAHDRDGVVSVDDVSRCRASSNLAHHDFRACTTPDRGGCPMAARPTHADSTRAPFSEADLPDARTCAIILRTLDLVPASFPSATPSRTLLSSWRRASTFAPELRRAHPLVFFSRRSELIAELGEAVQRRSPRHCQTRHDDDITSPYRNASVFAFPS